MLFALADPVKLRWALRWPEGPVRPNHHHAGGSCAILTVLTINLQTWHPCAQTFNSCLISWIIRKAKGIPILCLLHSEIVGLYRCTYWNKWVSNVIKFMQSLHFKYDRPHFFFFFACTLEALLSQANIFHYPNQTMANLIVKGPE